MRLLLASLKELSIGIACNDGGHGFPVTALFILQNFCTLKKYKRAATHVGSFHPTLYVNKRRTKKLYKLYTKPYILFVILLIISALRSVWFVLQTLHKLYTKPYTEL